MSRRPPGTNAERRLRWRRQPESLDDFDKGLQVVRRRLLFLIAIVSLSSPTPAVWALFTFDPPGQFVATEPCRATASIRSGSVPVAVQAGQAFKAFGTNKKKPDATHVGSVP